LLLIREENLEPKDLIMKILMVDDETDAQFLFKQRFRKEIARNEVEFAFAFSGLEALGYLNDHVNETKIVLSDINMPGMNGLELLQKIKQKFSHPQPLVMMISAYGDEENYKEAKNLGADDFFTKPVDFSLLKEKLKNI
jgi:two-component system, chemotaxis family, chemotaxis protein CheY